MEIKGTVALVTGGAQGLGLAIASYLMQLGATVIVADRDAGALADLPETLGRKHIDVTQPAEVIAAVGLIIKQHGRIDILVNNAGVIFSEPFVNIMNPVTMMHDYQRFQDSIAVNLNSVFIVADQAA